MPLLDKFDVPQWHVGLVRRPIVELLDGYRDLDIEWLHITPEPEHAADPFGVIRDGRLHVFFEFKPFGRDGFIAHVEVGHDNMPSPAEPVLRLPHHISYPFLFEFQGELFMIPESAQAGQVMLFRCARFPDRWEKAAVILPGVETVDNSIVQHAGRWWLFAACGEERAELHLWWAASPMGPWQPHPRNPVKTDSSSSRPAGTPFTKNGVLFRPAQDNSDGPGKEGRRIVLNHVGMLSTEEFCEKPVACLEPDAASFCPAGRHTLTAAGSITLVDGLRRSRTMSPLKLLGRIRS
jgi:hypothetical protein